MAPLITLITGCSSGIGLVTALRLANQSDKSFIVYATMRNMAKKGDLESKAGSALNDTLFIRQLDVTKGETITETVADIMSIHGRIDVLINNAGWAAMSVLEITPMETVRHMFEANFFGVVQMTQEVLPIMKKQRSGRIVNVSSTLGIVGLPFYDMYAASKFAVEGLMESLATHLRHFNIWVSTVQPGPVKTQIIENMLANNLDTTLQQEDKHIDPQTKELFTKGLEGRSARFKDAQAPEEVAQVIHDVIMAAKPQLRNPTSPFTTAASNVKYTSASGDEWVDRFYESAGKS